jgi:hypothetical protein
MSLLSIHPSLSASTYSKHGTFVLLLALLPYLLRDIWPLLTYSRHPMDLAEGQALWWKITFLSTAAVVVPVLEPKSKVPNTLSQDSVVFVTYKAIAAYRHQP